MEPPAPVQVAPAPSCQAFALLAALAACSCAIIASLPLDAAATGLALLACVVWAIDRIHVVALRRGPRSVRRLELRGDLTVVVETGDGAIAAGGVHRSSYVGARITTVVWRPEGKRRARAIMLLPDMLPAADFRRLRVLLRYGRSDVAQGEPASHA